MERQEMVTAHGRIYRLEGGCRDDWANIVTSRWYRKPSGLIRRKRRRNPITLQRPAIESWKAAEAQLGREIVVTGSIRTCELQAQLYASDQSRYAPPWVGLHTQGLAADVTTEDPYLTTTTRKALEAHGWSQARPEDEPWHFSMGWTA